MDRNNIMAMMDKVFGMCDELWNANYKAFCEEHSADVISALFENNPDYKPPKNIARFFTFATYIWEHVEGDDRDSMTELDLIIRNSPMTEGREYETVSVHNMIAESIGVIDKTSITSLKFGTLFNVLIEKIPLLLVSQVIIGVGIMRLVIELGLEEIGTNILTKNEIVSSITNGIKYIKGMSLT